jgi:hypothetical protein
MLGAPTSRFWNRFKQKSLDEEEIVKTDSGNVRIVPAWRWLLGW